MITPDPSYGATVLFEESGIEIGSTDSLRLYMNEQNMIDALVDLADADMTDVIKEEKSAPMWFYPAMVVIIIVKEFFGLVFPVVIFDTDTENIAWIIAGDFSPA